jgi:ribosome-binding factor A
MTNPRVREIKHAQKESQLLHEIGQLFIQLAHDEPGLQGLYVTRVKLSPDKSKCMIFIHALGGLKEFEEKRPALVMFKGSIRKALAQLIRGRYTPDLRFAYDATLDKQRHVDDLIDQLKDKGDL